MLKISASVKYILLNAIVQDYPIIQETIHTKYRAKQCNPSRVISSLQCDTDASQWRQLNVRTSINVRGPSRTHKQTFTFNWRVAWLTNGQPSEFRNISMLPPFGPVHDPRVGEPKRMKKKKKKKFPSRARIPARDKVLDKSNRYHTVPYAFTIKFLPLHQSALARPRALHARGIIVAYVHFRVF